MDDWAEASDDADVGIVEATKQSTGADEDTDLADRGALLEAALDVIGRIAGLGASACEGLHAAACELMQRQAWQAKHASLLVHLRLACAEFARLETAIHPGNSEPADECSDEATPAAASVGMRAATIALQHFGHVHPRVRWAALEVWARMLVRGMLAPVRVFEEAIEVLLSIAGKDEYARVRHRGLLVLLFLASCSEPPFTAAHVDRVFRRVLIPQASSPDQEVRDACASIAQFLATSLGLKGDGNLDMQDAHDGRGVLCNADLALQPLWRELFDVLTAAATASGTDAQTDVDEIVWPKDWR